MPFTQTRWPLFGALVVGVLAVALFWWFAFDEPRGEAVPASGGRYVEGVLRAPERINPLFSAANPTDADLAQLIFSGLVRLGPDGTPEPDLAERWEITNNGQRYVFHLRTGGAWHDGEAFDAEDVVFTYKAIGDPGFTGDPALAQLMRGVVITARDPQTVEFQLEQTYAPFLAQLSLGILPRHILADVDVGQLYNAQFNTAPIGTGPYRFVSREDDGSVDLASSSTYYLGPPPILAFAFRVFREQDDALAALRASEIDGVLIGNDVPRPDLTGLSPDDGWSVNVLPGAQYYMLYLDTRSPLFNDRDIRTALLQGVNRNAMVSDLAKGAGVPSDTGVPHDAWAHSGIAMPDFSPGDAATTLELEGFFRGRDGTRSNTDNLRFAFRITTADEPQRIAVAQYVAEQLQRISVAAEMEPVDPASFIETRLMTRDYEVALVLVDPGPDPDPYAFWHTTQIPPPGLNLAGYGDKRMDDAVERARQTTDIARRKDLYALFDGYFVAAMPSLPLYAPSYTYVQSTRVQGFEPRLLYAAQDRFSRVYEWYVETRNR